MNSVPASSVDPLNSFNTLPDGALTLHRISTLRKNFESNSVYRMAQNAVCKVTVDDVALNRQVVTNSDFTFSHVLDDWSVTNQKKSGRCWMFAGLNLLRVGAMKKMNLKEFEFSQNYMFFGTNLSEPITFYSGLLRGQSTLWTIDP